MQEYQNNPEAFPKSNGHIAWNWASNTIEAAAIEDLFWRKVQVSPSFAWEVVRTVWPDAAHGKWDAFIRPNLYVSLLPESCGAYTFGGWSGLSSLRGDASDTRRIDMGEERPDRAGYYLGPLIAKHKGWLPQNVVPNLLHAMGMRLSVSDRFRFSVKANHRQVPLGKSLTANEVVAILKVVCPAARNLFFRNVYWYKRECGDIAYGSIYLHDSNGNLYKFPLSAWEYDTNEHVSRVYDLLNIAAPYPLYDLDKIVRCDWAKTVLICDSEETVDYIGREHAWTKHWGPVTTYAAIDGTDWGKMKGKTPIIFPDATERGCHEAFRLYAALVKHGFTPRFLARSRGNHPWVQEFAQDIGRRAFNNLVCSLNEFAEHCQRVFGVKPPDGILPKAVALSDLAEPVVPPEVLLASLLATGEQMMLHAWRGVGKSLFALLLALCLASGKSALKGRVCPSRKYRVLLLDGEMSVHSLKKRARRLCAGHGLPADAIAGVKVRSIIAENKDLTLETDSGLKECMPDLMWADIVIVDSVFKFFPRAMNSDFTAVEKLLDFLKLCRLTGKTLILIDHEGKGRGTSFGTMGKEIALDVVLRLCHSKSPHMVEAYVQKVRDHAEPTGAYVKMRIEADDERITYQVCDDLKGEVTLEAESLGTDGEAESQESAAARTPTLDEAIIHYVSVHPDVAQGKLADAMKDMGHGGRSTIQARIKVLSEAGKLPGWLNRPETHKVAEQPVPEDGQN